MMGIEIPGWALGIALIVFVSTLVRVMARGGGSREKWTRLQGNTEHERRIADLEESQRQLGSGVTAELERRVGELEERLDFAERMLAKQRDSDRLGKPPQA